MIRILRTKMLLLATVLAMVTTTACEPQLHPDPGTFPATSRLGISEDGSVLFVALTDHDKVRAIDATSGQMIAEVDVEGGPHRLTVLSDGRVAVSARRAGNVVLLDPTSMREVARISVGAEPFGIIEADGHLVVAVSGEGDLARIDLADLTRVKDRITLNESDPRGLAQAPDGKIFVTHFSAGTVAVVDVSAGVVEETIAMDLPSRPLFFANQIDSITVTPGGDEIVVPHVQCNNDPAQFGASGGGDFSGGSVEYYVEGPTGFPAVVPTIGRIDIPSRVSISDSPVIETSFVTDEVEPRGQVASVINPLNTLLLGDDLVNSPVAAAMADGGRLEIMVNRGSGNVILRRNTLRDSQRSILAIVDVGVGAEAIVLSPDGTTAYVFNAFDYRVTSFGIPRMERVVDDDSGAVSIFAGDGFSKEGAIARLLPSTVFEVASQVLPDDVAEGRLLFHSVDERMTRRGAISCASCHPGGGDDGITWEFEAGPRQTPALWGGILGTEPFHWNDEVRDMADISTFTIERRMGGQGLPRDDMNKIGAFLDTIPAPAPPTLADFASVERGAEIFYSDATKCAECHAGADFTDNEMHDVGTGSGFSERETDDSFATPALKGLFHSGPYLHNGTAQSISDVIEMTVANDKMGVGSHLSEQDKRDLVHFLTQL